MTRGAMFPLGMVLFPGQVLPLSIFEPRYRTMIAECLRDDTGFAVVLIERGSEVGGGDLRTDVGTMAQIVRAQPYDDGRWSVVAVGTERIRVVRWLADDPYPCAEIEPYPEKLDTPPGETTITQATDLLRQVLAFRAELGETVAAATFEVSTDPVAAGYQLATACPFGPIDLHALLAAPGPVERIARIVTLLEDERSFCQARLAMETDPHEHD